MELELSLKGWNRLIEQLDGYGRILRRYEAELEEMYQSIRKDEKMQKCTAIIKSLHYQIIRIDEMKIALEKIRRLYEKYENNIVESGEGEYRRFPEKIRLTELDGWNVVSVILK